VSTVDDVVAVLGELNLLLRRDPDAVARREEILAAKHALLDRIRAEQEPSNGPSSRRDDDAIGRR
jgi:hypothetical protein